SPSPVRRFNVRSRRCEVPDSALRAVIPRRYARGEGVAGGRLATGQYIVNMTRENMRRPRQTTHTPAGAAMTELILETFRLNGLLLEAGDRLVAEIGLTSARWQGLGAIALAPGPLPVAHLARHMGRGRPAGPRPGDGDGGRGPRRVAART